LQAGEYENVMGARQG